MISVKTDVLEILPGQSTSDAQISLGASDDLVVKLDLTQLTPRVLSVGSIAVNPSYVSVTDQFDMVSIHEETEMLIHLED